MTPGSLQAEIPVISPDEAFVRRLAELAAASTASPGVIVPATFGSPAARALAAAAAVAAITAGAAAAADQLTHTHDSPAPPISTQMTDDPTSRASDDHSADEQQADRPGSPHSGLQGGVPIHQTPGTDGHRGHGDGTSSSGPDNSGPGNHESPGEDSTQSGDQGHGGSGSQPSDGSGGGSGSGDSGGSGDGASDGASDAADDSGGSGGGSGPGTSGGDSGGSGQRSEVSTGAFSRLLTGSGD